MLSSQRYMGSHQERLAGSTIRHDREVKATPVFGTARFTSSTFVHELSSFCTSRRA